MLGELYKYAIDNSLVVRPGFKEKNVKNYISFGLDGEFLGFDPATVKPMCPDIGVLANGTTKSNIIAEKAGIILNLDDKDGKKKEQKHIFYMESMREAAEHDDLLKTAINGLEQHMETIREEYLKDKGKYDTIVSIMVDGTPIESSEGYLEWWEKFRKSFENDKKADGDKARCFITGELLPYMQTVPSVTGLIAVGGYTKGDSLICFDKSSYASYGLKQAANATVSEYAMTGVNSALNKLFQDGKTLAGAKNIHWFSEKTEYDVIEALDLDLGPNLELDLSADSGLENEKLEDERRIKKLYDFLFNSEEISNPHNRYYMMAVSGVNGRVMIRSYEEGKYDELCKNIKAWYNDISIEDGSYPKKWSIYTRLLKYSESEFRNTKKLTERMGKELSGLDSKIIYSIFHNTPLPDNVAQRILLFIRSKMNSSDGKNRRVDKIACQVLKAWLNRKCRKENKEELVVMKELNEDSPSKAYQTGRLIAVYVALQNKALGDVGAGVAEKYYSSACTTPALVIGKLAQLSQYHLSKLDSGSKVYYNKMLQEIAAKIGSNIPKTYSLEEQSQFALGYYFQNAEIYKTKNNKDKEEDFENGN